jgi:hypothetical protein
MDTTSVAAVFSPGNLSTLPEQNNSSVVKYLKDSRIESAYNCQEGIRNLWDYKRAHTKSKV